MQANEHLYCISREGDASKRVAAKTDLRALRIIWKVCEGHEGNDIVRDHFTRVSHCYPMSKNMKLYASDFRDSRANCNSH